MKKIILMFLLMFLFIGTTQGAKVLIFSDNFNGVALNNNWSVQDTPTYAVSSGILSITDGTGAIRSNYSFIGNYEFKIHANFGQGTAEGFGTHTIGLSNDTVSTRGMLKTPAISLMQWYPDGNVSGNSTNLSFGEIEVRHNSFISPINQWINYTISVNSSKVYFYTNGILMRTDDMTMGSIPLNISFARQNAGGGTSIDFVEVYNFTPTIGQIPTITLNSPLNGTTLNTIGTNFSVNYSSEGYYNFTNYTYYLWHSNGTMFNDSVKASITGNKTNSSNVFIDAFVLGNYFWNVKLCYRNVTFHNCTMAFQNNSFTVGAVISSISFSNFTKETKNETFLVTTGLLGDSVISLGYLVYNGTRYSVNNITYNGAAPNRSVTLIKTIDIPIGSGQKNFYWEFTYEGSQIQQLSTYYQNVTDLNFGICNLTMNKTYVNFTIYDEINLTKVNSTISTAWKYWIGSGDVYKNFSFYNNQVNNTMYSVCSDNYNNSYYVDADLSYANPSYADGYYFFRNNVFYNTTQLVSLYLTPLSEATKFTITAKQGISFISNTLIYVLKYYTSDGTYRLIGIKETDEDGRISQYLDLDQKYQFIVNNVSIFKTAICESSPCSMTLFIEDASGGYLTPYYDTYSTNVVSNLTFDKNTNLVTYTFLDTTSTANYFRLLVTQDVFGGSASVTVCDTSLYTFVGSITCNMSGYSGDFTAKGFISRSPEKLDRTFGFLISEIRENMGKLDIIFMLAVILTMSFAGAVVSRGNPSIVITFFILGFIGTKLMNFNPFSWALVAAISLLGLYIIVKVRT